MAEDRVCGGGDGPLEGPWIALCEETRSTGMSNRLKATQHVTQRMLTPHNSTPTSVNIFPGLPHGFRRWAQLPPAKESDEKTLELIRWLLGLDDVDESSITGWHEYL